MQSGFMQLTTGRTPSVAYASYYGILDPTGKFLAFKYILESSHVSTYTYIYIDISHQFYLSVALIVSKQIPVITSQDALMETRHAPFGASVSHIRLLSLIARIFPHSHDDVSRHAAN